MEKRSKTSKLKTLGGLALAAATLSPSQVEAQEFHYVGVPESERVRTDLFWDGPLGTDVYTFIEAMPDGTYFSKSFVTKGISGNLRARLETNNGQGLNDNVGLGLEYGVDIGDGNILSFNAMPAWTDREGFVENSSADADGATTRWPKMQVGVFYKLDWAKTLPGSDLLRRLQPQVQQFLNIDPIKGKAAYGELEATLQVNGIPGLGFLDNGFRAGIHVDTPGQEDSRWPAFNTGVMFSYIPGK